MTKINSTKFLLIAFSVMTILSSCNLSDGSGLPNQTPDQNLVGTVVAMTLQVNSTQIQTAIIPAYIMPTAIASPMSTPIPANTPIWSVYSYTCEFLANGGNMTMNLAWTDRSNSEEGYKVYRDQQVIATLAPNSTSYIDVAFVAIGKTLSYSVEAFNQTWRASTSTITDGCR